MAAGEVVAAPHRAHVNMSTIQRRPVVALTVAPVAATAEAVPVGERNATAATTVNAWETMPVLLATAARLSAIAQRRAQTAVPNA